MLRPQAIVLDVDESAIEQFFPCAVRGERNIDGLVKIAVVDDNDKSFKLTMRRFPVPMVYDNISVLKYTIAIRMVEGIWKEVR